MGPHIVTETHWADSASEASVPCRLAALPGSMGLVTADLISAAAASLYYFLVHNEIMGSEQEGFVIIEGAKGGVGEGADREVAAFPRKSRRVTACGS